MNYLQRKNKQTEETGELTSNKQQALLKSAKLDDCFKVFNALTQAKEKRRNR